jgi:tRNA threonylcarbamoyladenosine biosynthesis protein TsaB
MSLILGIETATKMCSVALSDENGLLALKEAGGEYSHAENLNLFVADVCTQAGKELKDIDAIAVSKGPGSYTGLRIGVSAAKGFCTALDIPLISVDTLQAMAKNPSGEIDRGLLFCPMIDARRMEVYTALYDTEGNKIEDISAKIIDENSFSEYLKTSKIVFFGDGSEKCREALDGNPNATFIEDVHPSAKYINEIALKKFNKKEFEDVAYFEPFYLKDFIATTPKKLL